MIFSLSIFFYIWYVNKHLVWFKKVVVNKASFLNPYALFSYVRMPSWTDTPHPCYTLVHVFPDKGINDAKVRDNTHIFWLSIREIMMSHATRSSRIEGQQLQYILSPDWVQVLLWLTTRPTDHRLSAYTIHNKHTGPHYYTAKLIDHNIVSQLQYHPCSITINSKFTNG